MCMDEPLTPDQKMKKDVETTRRSYWRPIEKTLQKAFIGNNENFNRLKDECIGHD